MTRTHTNKRTFFATIAVTIILNTYALQAMEDQTAQLLDNHDNIDSEILIVCANQTKKDHAYHLAICNKLAALQNSVQTNVSDIQSSYQLSCILAMSGTTLTGYSILACTPVLYNPCIGVLTAVAGCCACTGAIKCYCNGRRAAKQLITDSTDEPTLGILSWYTPIKKYS
ncbi:MAG: hypothetical protein NTX86_03560 [Candidatus Dependentiae bacterium]|nr:hypothetical protein [Candidatus Dependentiae bacterium]